MHFTPKLWSTLVVVPLLCLLVSLGFWQLSRADEKEAILADFEAHGRSNPLSFGQALSGSNGEYRFYPIELTGHFDNAHPILLDNKTHEHRVGYHVFSPFYVDGADEAVLVNRGWIPRGRDRDVLPVVSAVDGPLSLRGMIAFLPDRALRLGHETEGGWPRRVQLVERDEISNELNIKLAPFIIQLDENALHGFVREWSPAYLTPERHVGYAVQWFSLAVTLLICFLVVSIKKSYE